MLDKQNLSKIKYIYKIYSADDMLHLERYPIVYINSKVVYFKENRKNDFLGRLEYDYISDTYVTLKPYYSTWYLRGNIDVCEYFFGIETDIQSIYENLKEQYDKYNAERLEYLKTADERNKRLRVEKAKREYEAALKELEALDNLKEG